MLPGPLARSPQLRDILDTFLLDLLRVQADLPHPGLPTALQSLEHQRARLSPRHPGDVRPDHFLHHAALLDVAGGEGQAVWNNGDIAIPHRSNDHVLLLEQFVRGDLSKAH